MWLRIDWVGANRTGSHRDTGLRRMLDTASLMTVVVVVVVVVILVVVVVVVVVGVGVVEVNSDEYLTSFLRRRQSVNLCRTMTPSLFTI